MLMHNRCLPKELWEGKGHTQSAQERNTSWAPVSAREMKSTEQRPFLYMQKRTLLPPGSSALGRSCFNQNALLLCLAFITDAKNTEEMPWKGQELLWKTFYHHLHWNFWVSWRIRGSSADTTNTYWDHSYASC